MLSGVCKKTYGVRPLQSTRRPFPPTAAETDRWPPVRTADEAHLRKQRQRSRTRRHLGLFRLGVQDCRITRDTAEQCPRIKADALDASIQQQAIEHALFVTFHEESHVAHFHCYRHLELVKKTGQLGQTRGVKLAGNCSQNGAIRPPRGASRRMNSSAAPTCSRRSPL